MSVGSRPIVGGVWLPRKVACLKVSVSPTTQELIQQYWPMVNNQYQALMIARKDRRIVKYLKKILGQNVNKYINLYCERIYKTFVQVPLSTSTYN